MILGLILKIVPFVSGVSVAVTHPTEAEQVMDAIIPAIKTGFTYAIEAIQGVPLS